MIKQPAKEILEEVRPARQFAVGRQPVRALGPVIFIMAALFLTACGGHTPTAHSPRSPHHSRALVFQPASRHPTTTPSTSTIGANAGVGSTTTPASATSSPVLVASRYVVLSNTVDYQWSNPYQWVDTIGSITTPAFAAQQRSIALQYLEASAAGHSNPVLERKWTIQQQQERSDTAVVTDAVVTGTSGIARSSQVVRVTYQQVTFTAQDPRPTAIGPPATTEITAMRSGVSWLVGAVGPSGLGS